MSIVKIENITKVFGEKENENKVLDNVSFKIEEGEFVSLMGSSGSGKSTLLYLIGGLDNPTSGNVYINDININTLKENNLSNVEILSLWRTIALEEPNDYKFVPPTAESATTTAEAETEDAEVKITAKAGNASIVLSQADVNSDGSVDAKDATVVLSDYAQSIASNATVLTPEIADANDDGVIDSKDATLILVYYADEISSK